MKWHHIVFGIIGGIFFICNAPATVFYVDVNSTNPTPPFTNWSIAATDIQSAVDQTTNGDLVLVTNGIYQTGSRISLEGGTNRVVVTNAITLQSVNGSAVTAIDGGNVVRCLYLAPGAVFSGFTLTNGNSGHNSAVRSAGGGAYCGATPIATGLIANCLVISNYGSFAGGGVMNGTASNCILSFNRTIGGGGGAEFCVLNNCVVSSNSAANFGGGAYGGILTDCVLVGNISQNGGGGAAGSTLNNCQVISNTCYAEGGGTDFCTNLNNCTVVGNVGGGVSSSIQYYPGYFSKVKNCIVYYNQGAYGNLYQVFSTNCCTTPLPSGSAGDFTNAPLFVNLAAGDFHLQSNSPCINAGKNLLVTTTTDFDGNPRIVGGTVDIGAYEYQTPTSILSYAWAQQYGLPTDGSADYSDADGDGMNNWQEWKAGTNPTNAASLLKLSSPSKNVSGVAVTWQSVTNVIYYLQSSTNLAAQPAFTSIQSNLVGQAGSTSYTDTSATNGGTYFYRVGVQ